MISLKPCIALSLDPGGNFGKYAFCVHFFFLLEHITIYSAPQIKQTGTQTIPCIQVTGKHPLYFPFFGVLKMSCLKQTNLRCTLVSN